MRTLLTRLWHDDHAAIIAVEWILIVAVLIFGLIAGLVALRNTIDATFGTVGNVLMTIIPNYTYSGFGIGNGGINIAEVGGYQFTPTTIYILTSSQITPVNYGGTLQVDPAP